MPARRGGAHSTYAAPWRRPTATPPQRSWSRGIMCFVRKVCRFAMKGLPLGVPGTTNGFWKRFAGREERTTSYYPYVILRPVITPKTHH